LIVDLGFAGTSTFGGPVGTPNFDRIANEDHSGGTVGSIIETGTAFPGNTGQIPKNVADIEVPESGANGTIRATGVSRSSTVNSPP